jgi:putative membrane protein
MKKILFCAMAITVFMWSACDDDDDEKRINETDKSFMINAAYANRAEIDAGQLAVSRSSDDSVKKFGQMMIDEHTTALNELENIADDRDVNLPDSVDAEHRQLKQQLMSMSGYEFDSAYIQSQIKDHQKAISLFESENSNGKEQQVKNYASKYLPHIRMHLEKANSITAQIKDNNNNSGGVGDGDGGTGTGDSGTGDGGTTGGRSRQ